ncbi:Ubiquitin-conjugating enzyme, E2 [Corchorus capsularis]|uniref:Ubiquitin-conjugating enzyme, E2 n=1 Tax=Corchorus capsularis TaxID=210143 RepID=A0A1R3GTR2_COCAP|nr:Ubiquitin-conjugating enzyme, E2 [Corchorus capsularis]
MALSVHSNSAASGSCEVEEMDVIPKFDVVSDESDHYFLNSSKSKSDQSANTANGVHKKIMQEWRILEKNLPDSIIVRVYEKRIDLLRAAIIGAAGTPYHDGLFFFDLAFPSDYPARPPLVYYRSFGYRINPNLYANGRVCLSLVNTWPGRKGEKWNPKESTMLQVLVSIQALVLNEKPYFNEPGYGIWPGKSYWEKKSIAYNEDVFVISCKSMLLLLRKPPKNFEEFVAAHFRERGNLILLACKSYANGRFKAGYFKNDVAGTSSNGNGYSTNSFFPSEKLIASLKILYPELVAAFSRTGACLGNSVKQLIVEEKMRKKKKKKSAAMFKKQLSNQVSVMRKTRGVAKVLFGKFKKVFGLKHGGSAASSGRKQGNVKK